MEEYGPRTILTEKELHFHSLCHVEASPDLVLLMRLLYLFFHMYCFNAMTK